MFLQRGLCFYWWKGNCFGGNEEYTLISDSVWGGLSPDNVSASFGLLIIMAP